MHQNGSIFLSPYQPTHFVYNEACLLVLEINMETLSEIPVSSNLLLKLSKQLILMFC